MRICFCKKIKNKKTARPNRHLARRRRRSPSASPPPGSAPGWDQIDRGREVLARMRNEIPVMLNRTQEGGLGQPRVQRSDRRFHATRAAVLRTDVPIKRKPCRQLRRRRRLVQPARSAQGTGTASFRAASTTREWLGEVSEFQFLCCSLEKATCTYTRRMQ